MVRKSIDTKSASPHVGLDLCDVDPRVGKQVGGGQRWDPVVRPTFAAG